MAVKRQTKSMGSNKRLRRFTEICPPNVGNTTVAPLNHGSYILQSTLDYSPHSGSDKCRRIFEGGGQSNEAVNQSYSITGIRFDNFDGG